MQGDDALPLSHAEPSSGIISPTLQPIVTVRSAVRSDQVIRENPASRGTEASAEVLVGPPWRMESNAGQQQRY